MREFWSLVCLAGLWGFVISTVGLILQGFPARGVLVRRPCLRWGGALLFCFIAWIVGMAHA
jgi:hypothetical protein